MSEILDKLRAIEAERMNVINELRAERDALLKRVDELDEIIEKAIGQAYAIQREPKPVVKRIGPTKSKQILDFIRSGSAKGVTASEIAEKTGIVKMTIFTCLANLQKRKLIARISSGCYVATQPNL